MKAQEIITTGRETGCCDDCSERILSALRAAAGASDTDTITIAADGTVGRLTEMLVKFDPHYQLRCFHTPQASCAINTHEVFYRVVTP